MLLLAVERLCQIASLRAVSLEQMLAWQHWSVAALTFIPGVWLLFSLSFARGNARQFVSKWLPLLALFAIAPLTLASWQSTHFVSGVHWTPDSGHWLFEVALVGKIQHIVLLFGAVLIIANLEWTFRAAVGIARWKVKYAVMGLILFFGVRIFTSSQVILYSVNHAQFILINSAALVLACLFIGFSFSRSRFASLDIYPSSTVLYKSLSAILAGVYLVIIGALAKTVTAWGGEEFFPLMTLLILVALVGLGVLSFSDRLRQAIRRFVSRHFQRPLHDYRQVWSTFTQRTTALPDRQAFAREVVRLISDTFEVLSVTLWLVDGSTGKLTLAASTALPADAMSAAPLPEGVLQGLSASAGKSIPTIDLDRSSAPWCILFRQSNPAFFDGGGHRFCLPLVSGGEVLGIIVLGDRVRGMPFSVEDLELLKCLGDHIAAGIRNLGLTEQLVQSRELEAFQAMSAFLVHDLKNTASALSLTLRNLPLHFDNPAFREDALRTLSASVAHVNDLIGRLTMLRKGLELHRGPADLNQLIANVLASLGTAPNIAVVQNCQPLPCLLLDARHLGSAIANFVLNARDAIGNRGTIHIETSHNNEGVLFAISDDGCGMTPEFLRHSLFKPFKTSKKNGLGIGMFQAKTIIEAHGGRITVQSEPGKGTTFRVWLPLAADPAEKRI